MIRRGLFEKNCNYVNGSEIKGSIKRNETGIHNKICLKDESIYLLVFVFAVNFYA